MSYVWARGTADLNNYDDFYGNFRNPIVRANEHNLITTDVRHRLLLRGTNGTGKSRVLALTLPFLLDGGGVIVVIVAVAMGLMTLPGIKTLGASMLASAGLAGLVVGMAMRPTLANLVAGIQIALTQPIRLEDAVIVAGEWGWIEEITATYVVIRIWDWRRLVVPLAYFIEQPFQNWTRTQADMIGTVELWVDFTVPVEAMREQLAAIVTANPLWGKGSRKSTTCSPGRKCGTPSTIDSTLPTRPPIVLTVLSAGIFPLHVSST